jgi:hybrid cluster-associated redox disulfide protein
MAEKVTKDMTVGEILEKDPDAAYSLMSMGLGCAGCPMSQFETLEQGAMVHGMDADMIIENLNKDKDSSSF